MMYQWGNEWGTMPIEKKPWGYHLVLDCFGANKASIQDKMNIENFAKYLVIAIDMVPYGEPQVVHFGTGDKEGFTLVQLIETSNIMGHFANESGTIFLDVFSCKEFDPDLVVKTVQIYFMPEEIKTQLINRG